MRVYLNENIYNAVYIEIDETHVFFYGVDDKYLGDCNVEFPEDLLGQLNLTEKDPGP